MRAGFSGQWRVSESRRSRRWPKDRQMPEVTALHSGKYSLESPAFHLFW